MKRYRPTTPSIGLLAVAYIFLGILPARRSNRRAERHHRGDPGLFQLPADQGIQNATEGITAVTLR